MLSAVVELPISHVFRRADARKINNAAVKSLMASIKEVGIINPLRVRPARRNVNGEPTDAYEVTAGAHRLDAAIHLGMEAVPCVVVDEADLLAELAMLDENLCRAELSPAERAAQTARRKTLYLELHPETKHGGDRKTDQVDNLSTRSFAAETAEITGTDARTVRRDVERGEKIADDVLSKVKGTKLDSGVYLDKIKKLGPEEQRAKVQRDLAAPKPVPKPAAPLNDIETKDKWLSSGMSWWNRGSREWREEFLALIDKPTMDAADDDDMPAFLRRAG